MGERKLKIADLAKDLGVHRNTITLLYYKRAKRIDFDVLDKLCKYFDCQISDDIVLNKDIEYRIVGVVMEKKKRYK